MNTFGFEIKCCYFQQNASFQQIKQTLETYDDTSFIELCYFKI